MTTIYKYNGRTDGIGNRIEQLITIQEYCIKNNCKCYYIWNNVFYCNHLPLIRFDNIEILTNKDERIMKYETCPCERTEGFNVKCEFLFDVKNRVEEYDIILHVRGTDRLSNYIKHEDYSNQNELNDFIEKTIEYVNNNKEIATYTIVSDDEKYIKYIISKINKKYVELSYDCDVPKAWLDYYYLTKTKKYILMCCKFSSYSITASIISNKKLLVYSESLKSNLVRYKADIEIII